MIRRLCLTFHSCDMRLGDFDPGSQLLSCSVVWSVEIQQVWPLIGRLLQCIPRGVTLLLDENQPHVLLHAEQKSDPVDNGAVHIDRHRWK